MIELHEQRSIILTHLPATLHHVSRTCERGDNDLLQMVNSRLTSGASVFGDRMFQMGESELRFEGTEELADALLYFTVARWASLGGE